jgi:hypothetical protein
LVVAVGRQLGLAGHGARLAQVQQARLLALQQLL